MKQPPPIQPPKARDPFCGRSFKSRMFSSENQQNDGLEKTSWKWLWWKKECLRKSNQQTTMTAIPDQNSSLVRRGTCWVNNTFQHRQFYQRSTKHPRQKNTIPGNQEVARPSSPSRSTRRSTWCHRSAREGTRSWGTWSLSRVFASRWSSRSRGTSTCRASPPWACVRSGASCSAAMDIRRCLFLSDYFWTMIPDILFFVWSRNPPPSTSCFSLLCTDKIFWMRRRCAVCFSKCLIVIQGSFTDPWVWWGSEFRVFLALFCLRKENYNLRQRLRREGVGWQLPSPSWNVEVLENINRLSGRGFFAFLPCQVAPSHRLCR